jgi:hypothetical protein
MFEHHVGNAFAGFREFTKLPIFFWCPRAIISRIRYHFTCFPVSVSQSRPATSSSSRNEVNRKCDTITAAPFHCPAICSYFTSDKYCRFISKNIDAFELSFGQMPSLQDLCLQPPTGPILVNNIKFCHAIEKICVNQLRGADLGLYPTVKPVVMVADGIGTVRIATKKLTGFLPKTLLHLSATSHGARETSAGRGPGSRLRSDGPLRA